MESLQPNVKRKLFFLIVALLVGISTLGILSNNKPVGATMVKSSENIKQSQAGQHP
ncbi:hypothetical protein GXP67_36610 [Rhodocytophaga rosea]|uniref:Uncharacterized protein n=1 Tax=Rhodocytophaga rosea TaxID=2704465 RepID=A0A6C0GVA6_9BACT|nr:hypothetical protein [Rhodocytophaga rosea]QHT71797.1 hypothetical protein GXP67_36610 [Rhodocytophaga rosea]